jgi:hypothetical protein
MVVIAAEDQPVVASLVACLGYGLMGALGGAALGLAGRNGRAAVRLAVAGLLAFAVGGLCNVVLAGLLQIDPSVAPPLPVLVGETYLMPVILSLGSFGIRGAMGGALLGLAFARRHSVRILSVAGFLGFGLGGMLGCCLFLVPGLNRAGLALFSLGPVAAYALWMGLCTAVGGAILGAVVAVLSPGPRAS